MPKNNSVKALVLLSGGLDTMLAVELLRRQGIAVRALCFTSAFFDAQKARQSAAALGVNLLEKDISAAHLALVKNPPHGWGAGANPCLDCHALMVKTAGELLKPKGGFSFIATGDPTALSVTLRAAKGKSVGFEETIVDKVSDGPFDFIATGEVLGQRPFSQTKSSLRFVEKNSGIGGCLLRPLSAKLLDETIPEREGLVDREQLLALSGRGRLVQAALAREWGISDYPQPAGGCILTQASYGQKLKNIFQIWPECTKDDVALLSLGRHFFRPNVSPNILIVLGRNKEENDKLPLLAKKGDWLVKMTARSGPMALLRPISGQRNNLEDAFGFLEEAKKLILDFTKNSDYSEGVNWKVWGKN